ncbi:MAG: hypothetical protein EA383_15825, partial [Spirochaetaceae bacterium]
MEQQSNPDESRLKLTPHDRYFRHVFTQPGPMHDLVMNVVVPELTENESSGAAEDTVTTIEVSSESFIDEELREHRTDLLVVLRTTGGLELAVYVLFEHKAQNEQHTIFQLMRYHATVLGHLAEQGRKKKRLPPAVLSVVVYNGPGRWTAPTELNTALGLSGKAAEWLNRFSRFRYLVFDVSHGMSRQFHGGLVSRTALRAMHATSRKLGRDDVVDLVHLLGEPELPPEFRRTTLRYLATGREDNAAALLATLKERGYTEMGKT